MRCVSVINTLFKYLLGFCFFFVLGIMIGFFPLGFLYSTITDNWQKDALLIGGLVGGIGLSFIYAAVCRADSSRRKKESAEEEPLVGQLFRWSFFTLLGVVLGGYLEFSVFDSEGYFLMGGFFFPICCFAYWYFVRNRAKADSTNGRLQQADSTTLESDASEKIRPRTLSRSSNLTPFLEDNSVKCVRVANSERPLRFFR